MVMTLSVAKEPVHRSFTNRFSKSSPRADRLRRDCPEREVLSRAARDLTPCPGSRAFVFQARSAPRRASGGGPCRLLVPTRAPFRPFHILFTASPLMAPTLAMWWRNRVRQRTTNRHGPPFQSQRLAGPPRGTRRGVDLERILQAPRSGGRQPSGDPRARLRAPHVVAREPRPADSDHAV